MSSFERRRRIGPYRKEAGRWRDTRTGRYAPNRNVKAAHTREQNRKTQTTPTPRGSRPPSRARPGARRTPQAITQRHTPPGPTRPTPSSTTSRRDLPPDSPRDLRPRPGQRKVSPNPGSGRFKENATYERHRGFYFKDATGRWRTPDGRVVKGQKQETRKGERIFISETAFRYNQRRHTRILTNDTVNLARAAGVQLSVKETREVIQRGSQAGVSGRREAIELLLRKAEEQGKTDRVAPLLAQASVRKWRLGGS